MVGCPEAFHLVGKLTGTQNTKGRLVKKREKSWVSGGSEICKTHKNSHIPKMNKQSGPLKKEAQCANALPVFRTALGFQHLWPPELDYAFCEVLWFNHTPRILFTNIVYNPSKLSVMGSLSGMRRVCMSLPVSHNAWWICHTEDKCQMFGSLWYSIVASLQLLTLSHSLFTCLSLLLRQLEVITLFYIISETSTLFFVDELANTVLILETEECSEEEEDMS